MLQKFGLFFFQVHLLFCYHNLFVVKSAKNTKTQRLPHLTPPLPRSPTSNIDIPSPLHLGNQIGDEGAAAVAGALEPRRNGDGSWTPSTALTKLNLTGEWVMISMVVVEDE
jgi:hypothetical protein